MSRFASNPISDHGAHGLSLGQIERLSHAACQAIPGAPVACVGTPFESFASSLRRRSPIGFGGFGGFQARRS